MENEDDAECRRKLDEKRKKIQKELREVERLSFASKEMQEKGAKEVTKDTNKTRNSADRKRQEKKCGK